MCTNGAARLEALVRSRRSPYLCKIERAGDYSLEVEMISACGYLDDDGVGCSLHGRHRADGRTGQARSVLRMAPEEPGTAPRLCLRPAAAAARAGLSASVQESGGWPSFRAIRPPGVQRQTASGAPWRAVTDDLEQLYQSTYTAVVRFLYRKVWDAERAEDLAQEVFVRALAHRPEKPRAWVFAVAANLARDEARAAMRRKRHLTLLKGDPVAQPTMSRRPTTRSSTTSRWPRCRRPSTP